MYVLYNSKSARYYWNICFDARATAAVAAAAADAMYIYAAEQCAQREGEGPWLKSSRANSATAQTAGLSSSREVCFARFARIISAPLLLRRSFSLTFPATALCFRPSAAYAAQRVSLDTVYDIIGVVYYYYYFLQSISHSNFIHKQLSRNPLYILYI